MFDPSYAATDLKLTPDHWKDAVNVQDAANIAGVSRSFVKVVLDVREEAAARGLGWGWADRHPIIFLWAYKLMALAGAEPVSDCGERWNVDNRMATIKGWGNGASAEER